MKKRQVSRLLTTMLSSAMIVAQMGTPMGVMAAEGDDNNEIRDKYEDEFEKEYDEYTDDDSECAFSDVEYDELGLNKITEEDIELVEGDTTDLIMPTDIKWEKPGCFSFHVNTDTPMIYGAEIYRNGEWASGIRFGDRPSQYMGQTYQSTYFSWPFQESGVYTVRVYVKRDDSRESEDVYSPEEPAIEWNMPSTRVSTPENVHWENRGGDSFAVAVCDPVEHAERYQFRLYEDDRNIETWTPTKNSCDFSKEIGDMTKHRYYISVAVWSDDLTKYANSLYSEKSEALIIGDVIADTQKDIVELGKDVDSLNIDNIVQNVKDLDNSVLRTSLQTDQDAVVAMAKIENKYAMAKGITVLPATSDVEKIEANQIEMTGAALNVSEGTVQLNVKDQKENGSSLINTDIYTNIIAFDMSVNSSEGIDFSKELEVPVTISMPIPSGMDKGALVILHYRADGTEEIIRPRIENGKAIFAITHFSTFAFAEEKKETTDNGIPRLIVNADGTSQVYVDGKENNTYAGLAQLGTEENAPFVYVENGAQSNAKDGSFVEFHGSKFYIEEGKVCTTKNGIQGDWKDLDENGVPAWYYLAGGQVVSYTGLAEYDNEWFYVEDGRLDITKTGYVEYDGSKFYVAAGQIARKQNFLTQDPNTGEWYYLAEGQVVDVTTLAQYDGAWFYIINGKLAEDYTGTVEYNGGEFYVEHGMVKENTQNGKDQEPASTPVEPETKENEYLVLGTYEQDGDLSNGPEPIEWECIGSDDNGKLLISRYVLDIQPGDHFVVTESNDYTLKKWLGNDFYNTAFSEEEKSRINSASEYPVFCLRLNEVLQLYSFNSLSDEPWGPAPGDGGIHGYSQALIAAPTAYAKTQGVRSFVMSQELYEETYKDLGYGAEVIGCEGAAWRLLGNARYCAATCSKIYVSAAGGVNDQIGVMDPIGVRPVIYITQ